MSSAHDAYSLAEEIVSALRPDFCGTRRIDVIVALEKKLERANSGKGDEREIGRGRLYYQIECGWIAQQADAAAAALVEAADPGRLHSSADLTETFAEILREYFAAVVEHHTAE
jgi:hypothetical protein